MSSQRRARRALEVVVRLCCCAIVLCKSSARGVGMARYVALSFVVGKGKGADVSCNPGLPNLGPIVLWFPAQSWPIHSKRPVVEAGNFAIIPVHRFQSVFPIIVGPDLDFNAGGAFTFHDLMRSHVALR